MREPLRVNTSCLPSSLLASFSFFPSLSLTLLSSSLSLPLFFRVLLLLLPSSPFSPHLLSSLPSLLSLTLPFPPFPPFPLLCSLPPHPSQMWAARAALLVHLRRYKEAELELAAFRELDNPDLYYQYHVHSYPGKTGEHLDTVQCIMVYHLSIRVVC